MKIYGTLPILPEDLKLHLQNDLHAEYSVHSPEELFYLKISEDGVLSLQKKETKDLGVSLDFSVDEKVYQKQKLSAQKDLLARAMGLKVGTKVCDLTLGFAGDSFKLAYLGAEVTGIEKNPMVFALVQNALWRYRGSRPIHLRLLHADSESFSETDLLNYDSFYLDPMYSHDRKALPKKEMQYLAEMLPTQSDEVFRSLMEKIFKHKKRLVVKRAIQSGPLLGIKPHHSLESKLVRFDVY